MAITVQQLLSDVRVSIDDQLASRFSDVELMTFFRAAIDRLNPIIANHRFDFGEVDLEKVFYLSTNDQQKTLPDDFISVVKVTKNGSELKPYRNDLEITGDYYIDGNQFILPAPITENTTFIIRYRQALDPNSILLSSLCPWGGRLNRSIADYVIFRAKNTDTYDTNNDISAMSEIEMNLLRTLSCRRPRLKRKGWL